jgi:hypothetical protein
MRVITPLSLLILCACAHHPSAPKPDAARIEWVKQLESESQRPPLITFGGTSKVSALSGAFPLDDRSAASVSKWLVARRTMFGLGNDDSLALATSTEGLNRPGI